MTDPPIHALALDEVPPFRPLTADAQAAAQGASLRVLAETGVAVGSPAVRARLAAAGARVDGDRVRGSTAPAPRRSTCGRRSSRAGARRTCCSRRR